MTLQTRLNWTKVGLKGPGGLNGPEFQPARLNWTKVGLKGATWSGTRKGQSRFELD